MLGGLNLHGQLGSRSDAGTELAHPVPEPAVPLGRQATAVAAGSAHICALLNNGAIRCWGANFDGALGSTTNIGTDLPVPMPQPAVALGRAAIAVAAGSWHTCALLSNGSVRCWGFNHSGQLGSPTNAGTDAPNPTPGLEVPLGRPAIALAAGGAHTCAVLDDGSVRCWGINNYLQLGVPLGIGGDVALNPEPQQPVPLGRKAVAVTAGLVHTCALPANGAVRCWGDNEFGELGSNTNVGVDTGNTPQPAVPLGQPATSVTAGHLHTCAELGDNTLRCWGWNYDGQLASMTNIQTDHPNPTPSPPARRMWSSGTAARVTKC